MADSSSPIHFKRPARAALIPAGTNASGTPEKMTVYIYALCDPETGEIRYVGKTVNLQSRLYGHVCQKNRANHIACWIKSIRRRGMMPKMEELERIENSNDEDWQEVERFWIAYLRFLGCRLCNRDSGGEYGKKRSLITVEIITQSLRKPEVRAKISAGNRGKKRTPEQVKAMRARLTGRKLSAEHRANIAAGGKGRSPSAETREKLRQINLGKKMSPEAMEKRRLAGYGKIPSAETRAKMSAASKGRPKSEQTKQRMRDHHARKRLAKLFA